MEKNIMKGNFPSIIREINFKFQIKDTKIETFSTVLSGISQLRIRF